MEKVLEPSSFCASFAAKQVLLDGSSLILQACLTAAPDFGSESIPLMKRNNYCNIMPALIRLMTKHCQFCIFCIHDFKCCSRG